MSEPKPIYETGDYWQKVGAQERKKAADNLRLATEWASEIAKLKQELAELKEDYKRACKTIADMHAAAVGEITGPKRGVIEDVANVRAEVDRLRDALQKAGFDIYEDDRSIGIQGHGKIFCNRKVVSDG